MTTIIVDRKAKTMAADRMQLASDIKIKGSPKIRRFKNDHGEWLVASAGCAEAGSFFDLWFEAGLGGKENDEERESMYPKDGEFSAVVLTREGRLYWYGSKGAPIEVMSKVYGLGSGAAYALGAVAAGATLPNAVRIASKFDPNTGEGVQVEQL